MDLDAFLQHLKKISTEEKSVIVPQEEINDALKGQIIPNKLNKYSTMTLEMLKLSTDDKKYYKEIYNRLIEKHDANITFRTINNNGNKEDYAFNKFRIIDALEWAKENNRLTSDEIEKYKLLKMSIEFNRFVEKYSNQTSSSIIEGNFVNLPVKLFIDLMTTNTKKLNNIIKEGKFADYDLDVFVYALDDFLDKSGILDKFYIPKNVSSNLSKLKENVDITHINRCLDYEYTYLNKVKINEELNQNLLENIPKEFDDLEKAFYIYYKMCSILTYDEEYFAKRSLKDNNIHNDFSRLSTITEENNKVICYEFNAIYARILKKLGIIYELNGSHVYGDGHTSLTFRIDKFLIRADSTVGMIKSDLAYAKNGLFLTGFTLENTNENTKKKFEEKIDRVYDYIKSNKIGLNDYQGTIRELSLFEKALPNDLSLEEKVAIFITMCKSSTLDVMDRIPYEIKLKNVLFKNKNLDNDKFQINYISYETDPNNLKHQTTKILTYNQNGINNIKNNNYIFIDPNNEMHKTTLKDIKLGLSNGLYRGLLNDKHTIPGVSLEEMNGKVDISQDIMNKSKERKYVKLSKLNLALNSLGKLNEYNNQELGQNKAHK